MQIHTPESSRRKDVLVYEVFQKISTLVFSVLYHMLNLENKKKKRNGRRYIKI